MRKITVANRELTFPASYVEFYEAHVCCSFADMAEIYLATELKTKDITPAISQMTDDEIIQLIKAWVETEYKGMGLTYANA